MQGSFPCTAFLPGKEKGERAAVSVKSGALAVNVEGAQFEVPLSTLEASAGGYSKSMLVLAGPTKDGKVTLYFEDRDVLRALTAHRLPASLAAQLGKLAPRPARKLALGAVVLLLAGLVAGLVYLAIPKVFSAVVDFAVDAVPIDTEHALGKEVASQALSEKKVCSNAELNAAVQGMAERLQDATGQASYEFTVRVVDAADPNAFALPGGYVYVNHGLLEKASGPDEVAGVMAHEFQHVLKRHGLRNLVGKAGIGLAVGLLLGDVQGLGGLVAGGAAELAALSFSREQEEEADRLGLDLLYEAGFDPQGLPSFFEKLQEEEKERGIALPSFLSTHPDTQARIDKLRELIAQKGDAEVKETMSDWATSVAQCDPVSLSDPDRDPRPLDHQSSDVAP